MGTGTIAARDEGRPALGDLAQRCANELPKNARLENARLAARVRRRFMSLVTDIGGSDRKLANSRAARQCSALVTPCGHSAASFPLIEPTVFHSFGIAKKILDRG